MIRLVPEDDVLLEQFKLDVLHGLTQEQKTLPCKYFYDERGSQLFEQITKLEEYYPTRTELAILQTNLADIVAALGGDVNLIEFGSGSSRKTGILLEAAHVVSYVPIDISETELEASSKRLRSMFPQLHIIPIAADYTATIKLPQLPGSRNIVFFPGSTIGNFTPNEATEFLKRVRTILGDDGALLIGVDLVKDTSVLERAYNDERGLTAQFNLNLIERINRMLDPNPHLRDLTHRAIFNEIESRIEMQLISKTDQVVLIESHPIRLSTGEIITTEYSYKYTLEQFDHIAGAAGLERRLVWADPRKYFSLQLFVPTDQQGSGQE
jgi:dimethylhistidine N-methyltransferase